MKTGLEKAGRVQRYWRRKDLLMAGLLSAVFAIVIIGVNYVYMLAAWLSRALCHALLQAGLLADYRVNLANRTGR
ncbi:hypothetical protein QYF48_15795 [Brevibacillus agri]|uniref:hypothetical protein n=1 Tax=Brevibacillus agri TaxID=51101 RepID=UPI0025B674FB|nr:hypothetical protein [Brevibacillus agri]MDN4094274.1 hypothetical protein [Brevibacillus agri]MDR9502842.1 hypothetical protein [Brevibacillus agri]